MEGTSKVTVKIYGQEYTIAGETTRETIIKVADYVDSKMNEMGRILPQVPISSLAVLTAINIAEEYFKAMKVSSESGAELARLEKDASHYVQLWEEAKKSYVQYKEDAQSNAEQLAEMQALYHEKTIALDRKQEEVAQLQKQLANKESMTLEAKELAERCKEIENNYFDLQMENIQLKGELDRLKKTVE